jgi:hypothetical protein
MDEMNIKTSHSINFFLNFMILKIGKFSKKQKEEKLVKFTLEKHILWKKQQNLSKTKKKCPPTPHTHKNSKK